MIFQYKILIKLFGFVIQYISIYIYIYIYIPIDYHVQNTK